MDVQDPAEDNQSQKDPKGCFNAMSFVARDKWLAKSYLLLVFSMFYHCVYILIFSQLKKIHGKQCETLPEYSTTGLLLNEAASIRISFQAVGLHIIDLLNSLN